MVAYLRKYTSTWLRAVRAGLAFALALAWVVPAEADDWRHKLRQGSHAGVAAPGPAKAGEAFAYSGDYRSGVTSNANEDFDPQASAYVESEQDLVLARKIGGAVVGLNLRGSLDAAFAADTIDYGDFEARASVAGEASANRAVSLSAGYRFEHDAGLRSHDVGFALSTRKAAGDHAYFSTLTLDAIAYEPQSIFGIELDRSDSDRVRLGLEHGVELSPAGGIAPVFSLGLVDVRHVRERDFAGYRRDSTAVFARAAARIAAKGPFSGEAGVMVFHRDYADADFRDRLVLLPEAELAWQATPKTSVSFSYLADLEETPFYGASNLHSATAALTLTRKLDERRAISAVLFSERDTYLEADAQETSRGAGLEYTRKLDGNLALSLAGEYQRVNGEGFPEDIEIWTLSLGFSTAYSQ